jgi:beta-lactamase regulating signal transducer with metallopeptidase domain
MSPVELLANPLARQLTLALMHFVWQGLAIAVLLVLAVELLSIRRPQARYACSLAALVAMLALPVVTFCWIGPSSHDLRASGFIPEAFEPPTAEGDSAIAANELALRANLLAWIDAAQPYALATWLLGVAIFAGRLSAGAIGVLRLRQKLLPLPLDLAANVERLGRRLQIDAMPLVFLSRRVTEAMAVGVLRPLVLIPAAWATEMPLEMLEAVIAHELAHLRRRDLWVNLLQRVAETVLFYHPAVWWLSHRLRQERELCADELAVAATGRRLEYAEALEQVARLRQADVGPALAAFMRGGKNMRLLERVRNVLGLGAEGDRSRFWPAGLLILALPLGLWALSLGLAPASADDDRDDDDRPRAARQVDDDDDDGDDEKEARREKDDDDDGDDEKEARRDKDDDDDGDDEKEARREKDDDDDDDAKEAKREDKDDDGDEKEAKKDEGGKKEPRKDGDVKKDAPRKDGDAPKKEGPRDGDVKKEGPRDGGFKKEGTRDGDVKKEGPRDGDAPKKEVRKDEPRKDGDKPIKEVRKDQPRKEGDKPIKEGGGEGVKKVLKEGVGNDGAVAELKMLVSKLMAENARLKEELAAARGGKENAFKKEGGEKEAAIKKEGGDKEAAIRKEREAAERKKAEGGDKEAAIKKDREAAERKKAEGASDREADERALIERKRANAEKEEAAARERLRREIDKKDGERKEGEKKEADKPK